MATYILLLTLTQEGREKMLEDPDSLLRAEAASRMPEMEVLGVYGVLGDYDFVSIVEAPDNDTIARFSLELGAHAGAHIATLPAVPIGRFQIRGERELPDLFAGVSLEPPEFPEEEPGGERGGRPSGGGPTPPDDPVPPL